MERKKRKEQIELLLLLPIPLVGLNNVWFSRERYQFETCTSKDIKFMLYFKCFIIHTLYSHYNIVYNIISITQTALVYIYYNMTLNNNIMQEKKCWLEEVFLSRCEELSKPFTGILLVLFFFNRNQKRINPHAIIIINFPFFFLRIGFLALVK